MFSPYNGCIYLKDDIELFLKDYNDGKLIFSIFTDSIDKLHNCENISLKKTGSGIYQAEVSFEHDTVIELNIENDEGLEFGIESIRTQQIEYYTNPDIHKEIAYLISKGHICGFFTMSSETGPRALCARSIIADPRYHDMKDRLNREVKHREMFRPFAPVVMDEAGDRYFIDYCFSPYMLETFQLKKEWLDRLPAITHIDKSARIQSVSERSNPAFYRVIREYSRITDVHVLLNTSFNLAGEPIVESPFHALICFLNSDIDFLFLDPYIVKKKCRKLTDNYL